jgi:O-methyltransferase involved in polyketide biosynthesis
VGDLSVTALYTSQTWVWGGLSHAHLFATTDGKRVFDATNAALGLARIARGSRRDARAPLRESLLHRHAMIDRLLRESGAKQVLELAAGLSRRGAAVTSDPSVTYVEVDLPPVILKKRALLARSAEGRLVAARPNLTLIEADAREAPFAPWLAAGVPALVIAEGLLMYLDAAAQRALFAKVAALAAHCGRVDFVFDLTPGPEQPPPGRAGKVLEALMKRFTGGRAFEQDTRTRAEILGELRAAGFAEARATDSAAVARDWGLPHPDARTETVLFSARK